jgi:acetoin utilization deacetylase AcuC-like enzyme
MNFVYSKSYTADIGPHVFPTEKYSLIRKTLKQEGIITKNNIFEPRHPANDALLKIITKEYLDDLVNTRMTERTYPSEMPVSRGIIDAQILCCGGSSLAAELALTSGPCFHIGGGFHHAFRNHAEGFCYLNDVVYAAVTALERGVERIAVIDCDLHQGNGTAHFFGDEERVFTFSMHQERLYPKKERSDLDIGLDIGVTDDEYLEKLGTALDMIFNEFRPGLVIYLAGADPYILDQLGSLRLTIEGLLRRDEMVCTQALSRHVPMAVVLGGGYAQDVADTVEIHSNTARVIHALEKKY